MAAKRLFHLGYLFICANQVYSALMSIAQLPTGVSLTGKPTDDQIVALRIGLTLANVDSLEARLKSVSDPQSPGYGKYLDADDVNGLFAPSEKAVVAVTNWLKAAGISRTVNEGWSISFATTVSTANELLNTTFAYYKVDGTQKLRTKSYRIPDEMASFIQLVEPTTYFGRTSAAEVFHSRVDIVTSRATSGTDCSNLITPDCLRSAYGVGNYTPDPAYGSRIGFGTFLNDSARFSDLNLYQSTYGIPEQNFTNVLINGGVNDQRADLDDILGEANLDSQFQSAISHPLPMTQFITGGSPPFVPNVDEPTAADNFNEPYLQYYQYLLSSSNAKLPQVISNSYSDDEQTVPPEYAKRVCDYIGLMGLRGITVLEASGDTGVGAACMSNDGLNKTQFTPQFPATCPYITSVGGLQSWAPEIAWDASSGGFSNYFSQAWYQSTAVETYLEKHISRETKAYYSSYTNFKGRGFPDISAHSLHPNYAFYAGGGLYETGGTSAAAPVVAGIISLLNDARLKAGKPTMGFINPFLYALGTGVLTDVTAGSSSGCSGINLQSNQPVPGGGIIPWASWNATVGWDPVTGLGFPTLQPLIKAALKI